MANLIFKGSKKNLPAERNADSFYLCEDSHELYFGTGLYTESVRFYKGAKPETPAQGVLYINDDTGSGEIWNGSAWKSIFGALVKKNNVSEADLENTLKSKINNKVDSVSAAAGDNTITVAGTHSAPTLAVKVSPDQDNHLKATANGLKVNVPAAAVYTIEKLGTATEGMSASYQLKKDGAGVGAVIDIPKDMVVKSGSVVTDPAGQAKGTYIELVLANKTEDKLYINVNGLIEYVTSGSTAEDVVFVTVDPVTHKVTAKINTGKITKPLLDAGVQASLGRADSAVQPAALEDLNSKKHSHANIAELNKISVGDKAKWDAAEQNAKSYTDSKNSAMNTRVAAVESALTIGKF